MSWHLRNKPRKPVSSAARIHVCPTLSLMRRNINKSSLAKIGEADITGQPKICWFIQTLLLDPHQDSALVPDAFCTASRSVCTLFWPWTFWIHSEVNFIYAQNLNLTSGWTTEQRKVSWQDSACEGHINVKISQEHGNYKHHSIITGGWKKNNDFCEGVLGIIDQFLQIALLRSWTWYKPNGEIYIDQCSQPVS